MKIKPEIEWFLQHARAFRAAHAEQGPQIQRVFTPRLVPELLRTALSQGLPVAGHPSLGASLSGESLRLFTPARTLGELQEVITHSDRPIVDDYLSSLLLGHPWEGWMARAGVITLPNRMTQYTSSADQARYDLYGWYGVLLTREAMTGYLQAAQDQGVLGEGEYSGDTQEREALLEVTVHAALGGREDNCSPGLLRELRAALFSRGQLTVFSEP